MVLVMQLEQQQVVLVPGQPDLLIKQSLELLVYFLQLHSKLK